MATFIFPSSRSGEPIYAKQNKTLMSGKNGKKSKENKEKLMLYYFTAAKHQED
jgi:hypothetical protein